MFCSRGVSFRGMVFSVPVSVLCSRRCFLFWPVGCFCCHRDVFGSRQFRQGVFCCRQFCESVFGSGHPVCWLVAGGSLIWPARISNECRKVAAAATASRTSQWRRYVGMTSPGQTDSTQRPDSEKDNISDIAGTPCVDKFGGRLKVAHAQRAR